jgi:hypothetical protein
MTKIMDVLYIRAVEKRLRRPLSEEERDGQPSMILFPNGRYERIRVPYLIFPYDLMSQPEEVPETADESLLDVA